MVRRGAVLYTAVGDDGFDIVDESDPTAPHSLVSGPVELLGRTRGVAVADNVKIPEGGPDPVYRNVAVFVGGGTAGKTGFIELRYADFKGQGVPAQTAAIGDHISGAWLCDGIDSDWQDTRPKGVPTLVRTVGTMAFVSTTGIGLQEVDLNAVAAQNTFSIVNTIDEYKDSADPDHPWDLTMALQGIATLAPEGDGAGFLIGAVHNKGVACWDVTSDPAGTPRPVSREAFPSTVRPSGAMRLSVYPHYTYGKQSQQSADVMLMAGGSAGLLVYQLTPSGTSLTTKLRAVIPMPPVPGTDPPQPATVYDAALDVQRHIAYVACYNAGVAIVDMSDPFRTNPDDAYGLLDKNGDGVDDRIKGFLTIAPGSRSTIVVDSQTGLVYVGDQGVDPGVKAVGAQNPRITLLLEGENGSVPGTVVLQPGLERPAQAGRLAARRRRNPGPANGLPIHRAGLGEPPALRPRGHARAACPARRHVPAGHRA